MQAPEKDSAIRRGTLFFELARLAEARKPPYLLFENVPGLGLINHDRRQDICDDPQHAGPTGVWRGMAMS
ncbi:DNA cytosine methyltransferase [Gemmiger formicilis]|uniref:DNA cytosine methyltransferase n=1 Tax=Gemmiger formicilis TaxID=745368 RepID=UPI003522B145